MPKVARHGKIPDLFDRKLVDDIAAHGPLADRVRPSRLEDFEGQEGIVGAGKLLRQAIAADQLPSMIFWGPPGSGKTTLAWVIAKLTKSVFVQFSAVSTGMQDLREVIVQAEERRKLYGTRTILFLDEIHRWNKAQQDALLPYVERGVITLIGATTENPSFEVNAALLSRSRVFTFTQLSTESLVKILQRAIADRERGLGEYHITADPAVLKALAVMSSGDARVALNALEFAVRAQAKKPGDTVVLEEALIKDALQRTHLVYDRAGEEHYNIISALHKSVRGGDADAALYWLGRMLEAGEDPLYVARRLVRMSVEDIGLADPRALEQATAAYQACHVIGMPECDIILAQCVVYLARAPKSVEVYRAYGQVKEDVRQTVNEPVPLHLRNAPTDFMQQVGYGKGYKYSPEYNWQEEQEYLP
ncbi:MAG: replication-associated recombination protein A, partial [Patescibacteria group bacterium]|nr:replication-associated recombination protein A [Patescibacteria group bacterium]